MNRGAFQSSLVQQLMGGSPSWWNMNNLRLTSEQNSPLLPTSSSSASSSSSSSVFPQYPQPSHPLPMAPWHDNQELPESWSQLLLGGFVGEEDRYSTLTPLQAKKMENWEEQVVYPSASEQMVDVKHESSESGGLVYGHGNEEIYRSSWCQMLPASSHRSNVTTSFSSNMLDFSNCKEEKRHLHPDHSSECNSATGAAFKKARVQASSSTQSTFKVRKEKLGDRITALHQLVSPFGKTDTASVLLEAIGYIRFLQSQIEALSSPYLGSGSGNRRQPAQGERSCIFPEDPGQLLNDTSMKKRGAPDQDADDEPKRDLRSRGLCLVPVSCTLQVGSDNGADYWAPTLGGGFR